METAILFFTSILSKSTQERSMKTIYRDLGEDTEGAESFSTRLTRAHKNGRLE